MKSIIVFSLLFFTGCVSSSYYQRKVYEARQEELGKAICLADQVRLRLLTAKDMIKILNYRRETGK